MTNAERNITTMREINEGKWRTSSSGHRIYIERGKVTRGNPYLMAAIGAGKPKSKKKRVRESIAEEFTLGARVIDPEDDAVGTIVSEPTTNYDEYTGSEVVTMMVRWDDTDNATEVTGDEVMLIDEAVSTLTDVERAILDFFNRRGNEPSDSSDIARDPALRGVHFKQIEKAIKRLASSGLLDRSFGNTWVAVPNWKMGESVEESLTPSKLVVGKFYAMATSSSSTEPDTYLFVTGKQANGTAKGIAYDVGRNKSSKTSFNGFNLSMTKEVSRSEVPPTAKSNMARKLDGKSFDDYTESVEEAAADSMTVAQMLNKLRTTVVKRTEKMPATAPINAQIMGMFNRVSDELKPHMSKSGMEGIQAFVRATQAAGFRASFGAPLTALKKTPGIFYDKFGDQLFVESIVEADSRKEKEDRIRAAYAKRGTFVTRAFDPDEYPPIKGMEGPFQTRRGMVVYYDPREGRYYDSKSDMYFDRDFSVTDSRRNADGVSLTEAFSLSTSSVVQWNKADQIIQITPKIGRFTAYSAMPIKKQEAKSRNIEVGKVYSLTDYTSDPDFLLRDPIIDDFDIEGFLKKIDSAMDKLNLPPAEWALMFSEARSGNPSGWMMHMAGQGPISPVYLNRVPSPTAVGKFKSWGAPRSPHTMVHEYAHVVWFGQMSAEQREAVEMFYAKNVKSDPNQAVTDKISPTPYGTTNVAEFWAEIVGYAMYGRGTRIAGESFDLVKDVLAGTLKTKDVVAAAGTPPEADTIKTPAPKDEQEPKKAMSGPMAAINAVSGSIKKAIGDYGIEARKDGSIRIIPNNKASDPKTLLSLLMAAGFNRNPAGLKSRVSTGASGGIVVFESKLYLEGEEIVSSNTDADDATQIDEMAKFSAGDRAPLMRASKEGERTPTDPNDTVVWERTTRAWMDDGKILKKYDVRFSPSPYEKKPKSHSYGWKTDGKIKSDLMRDPAKLLAALESTRAKLMAAGWTIEEFNPPK